MLQFSMSAGVPFLKTAVLLSVCFFISKKGIFWKASTQIPGGHFSNVVESAKKFFEFFACQGHPGPKMLTH